MIDSGVEENWPAEATETNVGYAHQWRKLFPLLPLTESLLNVDQGEANCTENHCSVVLA